MAIHHGKSGARRLVNAGASQTDMDVRKGSMDRLMGDIRALGCIPKDDHGVAQRFRKAQKKNLLSEEQLAELAETARVSIEPRAEETEPTDPREAFSEETSNRLEQDLLMAKHGLCWKGVMRRVNRYKKYMTQLGAEALDVVQ